MELIDWLNIVLRPCEIIYDYVETDDDNDNEMNRNLVLQFKDKRSFTFRTT